MSEVFLDIVTNDKKKTWEKKLEANINKSRLAVPRGYSKDSIAERWEMILKKDSHMKDYFKRLHSDLENRSKDDSDVKKKLSVSEMMENVKKTLLTKTSMVRSDLYTNNIENFIGMVEVPLGVVGPLKVSGLSTSGEYFIPLATFDGTSIVNPLHNAIHCINKSGGVRSATIKEGVSRDPLYCFETIVDAGKFVVWVKENEDKLKEVAQQTTKHGKLYEIVPLIDGNYVHLKFIYHTGDASGQNMVTIATQNVVLYVKEKCPVKIKFYMLEGGWSSDKKACSNHVTSVRGKRVVCEAVVKKEELLKTFSVTPESLISASETYWRGLHWCGSIGFNISFAQYFSAMAIALGQDPACVSEAHIGSSRFELTKEGDLYIAVVIPNLIVGSVGGGTKLPCQRACLELMGISNPKTGSGMGNANQLAEVIGACLLCGELASLSNLEYRTNVMEEIKSEGLSTALIGDGKSLDEQFLAAQGNLMKLSKVPAKEMLLSLYGLYKQATVGDCDKKKPTGLFSTTKEKKKHEAWLSNNGMSKEDAKKKYIQNVNDLIKQFPITEEKDIVVRQSFSVNPKKKK